MRTYFLHVDARARVYNLLSRGLRRDKQTRLLYRGT